MRLKNQITFIALAMVLLSCGGPKKVQTVYPPAPNWVKNRPVFSEYYVGIGSATKTVDINQTIQSAKQNALADMASDISVNISTNSLLSKFDFNNNATEDFTKTIKAQAEQDLEGYETVGNYEDQDNYWVYFRLSKANYQRIKEERRSKAITKALDFYDKGVNAEKSGDVRLAFLNLIKAIEPLKPYFSDPLQTEYNGNQIYLGNEIYREISQVLGLIRIEPVNKQVNVKQGQQLSSGLFDFKVTNQIGQPLNGLTLNAAYTEKPLRNSKVQTDINGIAPFIIDIVRSSKNAESLKATLNLEVIANEATTDFIIRKLFTRFQAPEASIIISIVKPIFFISSNETNIDAKLTTPILADAFKRQIMGAGYTTTNNEGDADYRISIIASTVSKGESGTYKQTQLTGIISVKDRNSAEVYSKRLENINGTHFDYSAAGLEAYKEAVKKIEFTIAREVLDGVVKGKSVY